MEAVMKKTTYRDGHVYKVEQDMNSDGQMDMIFYYGRQGSVNIAKADLNFDGGFETSINYLRNLPLFESSDTNADGEIDLVSRYIDGVLFSVDFISPESGKIKKRSDYVLNKLVKSEIDTDGDGKLDSTAVYDFYEEKSEDAKLN